MESTPKDVYKAIVGKGLINGLLSTMNGQPEPEVGMGITEYYGSDRRPGTVVTVSKDKKTIGIVNDTYKAKPGTDYYDQDYDITPGVLEPGQEPQLYTLRPDGKYRPKTQRSNKGGQISIGSRSCYSDPHI